MRKEEVRQKMEGRGISKKKEERRRKKKEEIKEECRK